MRPLIKRIQIISIRGKRKENKRKVLVVQAFVWYNKYKKYHTHKENKMHKKGVPYDRVGKGGPPRIYAPVATGEP
nr:MAG TPA: hypothetical protein [Caudoviricetes sp.]